MAKKKRIRNMTRAQHKQTLQRAVTLQNAAVRQVREKVVLPKSDSGDDLYTQVVKAGQEILKNETNHSTRREKIKSYYSRQDIQQAMFNYAKGRKISVLKTFRPMFSGSQLRQPEDVLPIMMFYSQDSSLWPSMHGTVSRLGENKEPLCDLVIEVDYKKSRTRCFNLTRPLIRLFVELDLEFRVKYSGHSSPHVIIPGEAFPEKWRRGGNCRRLYTELLDFFKNQIKEPRLLDRSFKDSGHFLRMLYSLNENTGLASIPVMVEEFDRFSWQDAYPEQVLVIDDWWDITDEASEKTESLIEFVHEKKRTFAMPKIKDNQITENLPQSMPELISKNAYMGIITASSMIDERYRTLSSSLNIDEILGEMEDDKQSLQTLSQKYDIGKDDLILIKRYTEKAEALAYYARQDVQEYIYAYAIGRCIRLGNGDQYVILENPSDIFPLAVYMVSEGITPTFQCTNAKYDTEDESAVSCDIVLELYRDIDLSNLDAPCFALYTGDRPLSIIFPFEILNAGLDIEPTQLSEVAYGLRKYFRDKFEIKGSLYVCSYESSTPIPYTLDDNQKVHLPMSIEHLQNFSESMSNISAIEALNEIPINTESEGFFNDLKSILGKGREA